MGSIGGGVVEKFQKPDFGWVVVSFNIKEENRENLLVVVGSGDVMKEAVDSNNCSSLSSPSHLVIVEEVCCFVKVGKSCSNNLQ